MGPKEHMAALGRKHEHIWNRVDALREAKGKEIPDWPAWCFLPVEYWHKALRNGSEYSINQNEVYEVAAIGAWRYGQGIYRFHDALYDALSKTSLCTPASDIAMEVFYRLPEWCIYVETPHCSWQEKGATGFWAHLDYSTTDNAHYLCLVINSESGLIPVSLKIGSKTIREALACISPYAETLTALLNELLSLLLYICLDNPGIESATKPGSLPERARPTRTKDGWRLFAVTNPRVWNVGREAGQQLQLDERAITPQGKNYIKPMLINRGCWEGNWKELEGGKKRFEYRWISPNATGK